MPQMQPEEMIRSIIALEAGLQREAADEERKAAAWLAERKAALEAGLQRDLQGIAEGLSKAGRERLEEAKAQAARIEAAAARQEARFDALADETLVPLVASALWKALLPEET